MTRSGVYQIDPDGPFDKSEMPMKAYCDFNAGTSKTLNNSPLTNEASPIYAGTTEIRHDLETPKDIQACQGAGCHDIGVSYTEASLKQIETLISLSERCYQYIQVIETS